MDPMLPFDFQQQSLSFNRVSSILPIKMERSHWPTGVILASPSPPKFFGRSTKKFSHEPHINLAPPIVSTLVIIPLDHGESESDQEIRKTPPQRQP
jgi:hypothetical protein